MVSDEKDTSNKSGANLHIDDWKNYQCQFTEGGKSKNYSCDIISHLEIGDKNWINFDFDSTQKTKVTKDKLSKNNFFKLNVDSSLEKLIKMTGNEEITILPKIQKNGETDKIFGKFKVIAGRNRDQIFGKFNHFLGAVSDIKSETSITATKCKIGDDEKELTKNCSLFTFADSQTQKDLSKNYSELGLIYKGSDAAVTTIAEGDINKYYIVKFTDSDDLFSYENIKDKDLIYLEVNGDVPNKKIVKFKPYHPIIIHTIDDAKKVLIIS